MRWAQLIDHCWWSSWCLPGWQVPREAVPSLIGKKGANLSRIREESGALIDVPNNDGSNAKLVRTYIHTIPNEHHPPLPPSRASLPALAAAGLTRCCYCCRRPYGGCCRSSCPCASVPTPTMPPTALLPARPRSRSGVTDRNASRPPRPPQQLCVGTAELYDG